MWALAGPFRPSFESYFLRTIETEHVELGLFYFEVKRRLSVEPGVGGVGVEDAFSVFFFLLFIFILK